jgi:hypothetical protein
MTGSAVRIAVLSIGALIGTFCMKVPVPCIHLNDSRVLYLLAQYKMAIGDENSSKELVTRAAEAERSHSAVTHHSAPQCPSTKG